MTVGGRARVVETARRGPPKRFLALLILLVVGIPAPARASIFEDKTLDKVANALASIVLIAPVIDTRT
jgi:hypothetical protein